MCKVADSSFPLFYLSTKWRETWRETRQSLKKNNEKNYCLG